MPAKYINSLGEISISDIVIANIAGLSVMESYGIVGMAARDAKDGLYNLLMPDNLSKGVKVSVKDNKIDLDLHVVLEYGVKISVVCENIKDKVKFNVENQTGMIVDKINIFVQGLRMSGTND